jgi:hypothetical protein
MHDFLGQKRPNNPHVLWTKIASTFPDPVKQRKLFFTILLEDNVLLRAVVDDFVARATNGTCCNSPTSNSA